MGESVCELKLFRVLLDVITIASCKGSWYFHRTDENNIISKEKKIGWKHTLPLNGGDENKGDGKENEGRELAYKF